MVIVPSTFISFDPAFGESYYTEMLCEMQDNGMLKVLKILYDSRISPEGAQ